MKTRTRSHSLPFGCSLTTVGYIMLAIGLLVPGQVLATQPEPCDPYNATCPVEIESRGLQMAPATFKFQARISQAKMPVGDGDFRQVFVIINDGACEEVFQHVRVRDSVLNLKIGSQMSCTLEDVIAGSSTLKLTVCINSRENCLTPIEMSTVPFAVKASFALQTEEAHRSQIAAESHYTHRAAADLNLMNASEIGKGYFDFVTHPLDRLVDLYPSGANESARKEGFFQWTQVDGPPKLHVSAKHLLLDRPAMLNEFFLHSHHTMIRGATRIEPRDPVAGENALLVIGDASVEGNQSVSFDQQVGQDQRILGNQMVGVDQTVQGSQEIVKNQLIKENQTVKGNSLIEGAHKVQQSQTVVGDQVVQSNATVVGHQIVQSDARVQGNQTVDGNSTVRGIQTVESLAALKGGATVEGIMSVVGGADGGGAGTLDVAGTTNLAGNTNFVLAAKETVQVGTHENQGELVVHSKVRFKGNVMIEHPINGGIGERSIYAEHIGFGEVKTENIEDESVTSKKIRLEAVRAEQIAPHTVTNDRLSIERAQKELDASSGYAEAFLVWDLSRSWDEEPENGLPHMGQPFCALIRVQALRPKGNCEIEYEDRVRNWTGDWQGETVSGTGRAVFITGQYAQCAAVCLNPPFNPPAPPPR